MADQRIGFELEVKTNKTGKELNEVELKLDSINKQLREAKKFGDSDAYGKLRNQQRELKEEAKRLNTELRQQKQDLGQLVDRFRIGGVSVGDFKAGLANTQKSMAVLNSTTKASITVMKVFRIALAATGVGLLVIALGSLVAFLTKTQKGMDFVAKVSASVSAVFGKLIERVAKFGEGLFKVLTFDLSGFTDMKQSIQGIGGALVQAGKDGAALEKTMQDLAQEEIGLKVILAERRRAMKDLEEISKNVALSEKERTDAAKQALAIAKQVSDIEEGFLNRKIEALRTLQGLGITNREDEAELADLIADRDAKAAANTKNQTKLQSQLNTAMGVFQTRTKATKEIAEAVEGSLTNLTEKLGKLNTALKGETDENIIRDKIKEIIDLEGEIESLNNKLFGLREQLTRGETPGTFGQLEPAGDFGTTAIDATTLEDPVLEAAKSQNEKLLEEHMKFQEELEKIEERKKEMYAETYGALGEITGLFIGNEIKSFQDYAKVASGLFIDLAVKQVESLLAPILARLTANLGIPAGPIASAAIIGVIKGLLNSTKSKISKLEEGGQLNPGFVAKGARHAHGGIPIGNGQEIEGGEPVLTRRAAQLFPDQINAINMMSGGRRILAQGGILGTSGPVLGSNFFNSNNGIDSDMLASKVAEAVYQAASSGLQETTRRLERERELRTRNVA